MKLSKRSLALDSSGIRRVFDLAAKLEKPVNLSIGQPDFDVSEAAKQGAKAAIDEGKNGYTLTQGIPELRNALKAKYGISPSDTEIDLFVTCGVSAGIFLSYAALLDPGDEALIPDPFFCMYRDLALLMNAKPVYYNTYPRFRIRAEELEALVTPRTKLLVTMTPGNPTGVSITERERNDLIALARHYDLWILSDEIYESFSYDSLHAGFFGHYEKTIIVNGFSKSHGAPGWRVGYGIAPTTVVEAMLKIQQYSFVCSPSIAQWGMLRGMEEENADVSGEYRKKRDRIYEGLHDLFDVERPTGAFYIFPRAPKDKGQEFVERCIANNLLVVPGNVFSTRDSHFRISFAAPEDVIDKGVEILRKLMKS